MIRLNVIKCDKISTLFVCHLGGKNNTDLLL